MSRVNDKLIKHYYSHYARINTKDINAVVVSSRDSQNLKLMYESLLRSVPDDGTVLDLGCGTGNLLAWLVNQHNFRIMGVDASASQIEVARQNLPNVPLICADGLEFLRNRHNEFSGIICNDVLEHLPNLELCVDWLEAAYEALCPGGFFFCRVPNASNLFGNYSRYMDLTHERCFTSASLMQLLEVSDFKDCHTIPIRLSHFSGRVRLWVEHYLHMALFKICGRGIENIFTSNICAIGFKEKRE